MISVIKKAHVVKYFFASMLIGGLSLFFILFPSTAEQTKKQEINERPLNTSSAIEVTGPLTVDVILQKQYVDGTISEEVVQETILSMEDFWQQYSDWQLVDQKEGQIIFKKNIDDIAPILKTNGYFGISEDGTLQIFKGVPTESNEVIQSFFQIDVSKLESRQQEELKRGIPVQSKDHYQQVIESFKTLSIKQ